MEYSLLFNETKNIIIESGKLVEKFTQNNIYEKKGQANFVSFKDLEVQDFLIESLKKLLPEAKIITEESSSTPIPDNNYYWIIDPIDGTTNLIHNNPHFSTSIALIKNKKPIIGLIFNPVNKELFSALEGKGAFLNDEKISVSNNLKLKESILSFGFPYDKNKISPIINLIKNAITKAQDLRRTGSAALDLAYLACGRTDGHFELDLEIWDYAAGILIIQEAGGKITDWNNNSVEFKRKSNLLATNNSIHNELYDLITVTQPNIG